MNEVNQKTATFNAIISVLASNNITFEEGMEVKELLTTDLKKDIKNILFEGVRGGTVSCSKEEIVNDDTKLNTYCNGLISNWVKKDTRLNGDVKYKIKNPGSRAGQGDETVKELRKLLKEVMNTDAEAEVKEALEKRVAEVKDAKTPDLVINIEAIPEHLRHLVK